MSSTVKILDIFPDPLTADSEIFLKTRKEYSKHLREISGGFISVEPMPVDKGMVSIESFYDEAVNTLSILKTIKSLDKGSYDAIIIDCMGDPGLDAAREVTDIPVLGALESSAHLASIIGDTFGIVGIMDSTGPTYKFAIRKYGLQDKLVGISTVNIPVLNIDKDRDKTLSAVLSAIDNLRALGANAVLLGCTGLTSFVEALRKSTDLQVIDPLAAAIGLAVQIKITGVGVSKRVWPYPQKKEFIGGEIW